MKQHLNQHQVPFFFILICFLAFLSHQSIAYAKSPAASNQLLVELTGKDPSKTTELEAYSEYVSVYRSGVGNQISSQAKSFLSRFPNSPYADNVLFLLGRYQLSQKNYVEAIRNFQKVVDLYPNSNKAVSALFAKAMAYQQMHLPEQAIAALKLVKTKFPGSPESFRADNQIHLLDGGVR